MLGAGLFAFSAFYAVARLSLPHGNYRIFAYRAKLGASLLSVLNREYLRDGNVLRAPLRAVVARRARDGLVLV